MASPHEIEEGIKFSKNGMIKFIEEKLAAENSDADSKWVRHLNTPSIRYFLKKGGTKLSSNQPFFRSEITLPKPYKIEKLVNAVWNGKHTKNWDKNIGAADFIEVDEGKKSYHISYIQNKK